MLSAIGHVFTAPNLVSETLGQELLKEVARACAATMPPCNSVIAALEAPRMWGNKNYGACAEASVRAPPGSSIILPFLPSFLI